MGRQTFSFEDDDVQVTLTTVTPGQTDNGYEVEIRTTPKPPDEDINPFALWLTPERAASMADCLLTLVDECNSCNRRTDVSVEPWNAVKLDAHEEGWLATAVTVSPDPMAPVESAIGATPEDALQNLRDGMRAA